MDICLLQTKTDQKKSRNISQNQKKNGVNLKVVYPPWYATKISSKLDIPGRSKLPKQAERSSKKLLKAHFGLAWIAASDGMEKPQRAAPFFAKQLVKIRNLTQAYKNSIIYRGVPFRHRATPSHHPFRTMGFPTINQPLWDTPISGKPHIII